MSQIRGRAAAFAVSAAAFLLAAPAAMPATPVLNSSEGHVNFYKHTGPADDSYTSSPTSSTIQFMDAHFLRLMTYSGYWDSKLSWYPNAWAYLDSYAIYTSNTTLLQQHPDWVLKDASGNKLYINYACGGGTCTQYAANITNPNGFRAWWIAQAQADFALNPAYKGLFVDDVNLDLSRISNGYGTVVTPIDPNTGQPMTNSAWRGYFADFMAQVRAALPSVEIVHNSLWFLDWTDSNIQREIQASDWIELERGVNDGGLTGGTGTYSLSRFFSFIDNVHSNGKGVIFDGETPASDSDTAREYSAAAYLLVSSGKDLVGDQSQTPTYWWSGFTTDLGKAQGARYSWQNLLRRDFAGGIALVNPPGSGSVTVTLPGLYTRVTGTAVNSVTLGATQGAILNIVRCDVNRDGVIDNNDVQAAINQAVGAAACGIGDINQDGQCTATDVQRVINASLGGACAAQ